MSERPERITPVTAKDRCNSGFVYNWSVATISSYAYTPRRHVDWERRIAWGTAIGACVGIAGTPVIAAIMPHLYPDNSGLGFGLAVGSAVAGIVSLSFSRAITGPHY